MAKNGSFRHFLYVKSSFFEIFVLGWVYVSNTRGSIAVQISTATDRDRGPRPRDRGRDRGTTSGFLFICKYFFEK